MDLPIRMLLPCPGCGRLHVDYGEWSSRMHTSHLCEHCGLIWKPCLLPTVGVETLCLHSWVERRWYVGGDQGSVMALFCSACGERHPGAQPEKPAGMTPPPGCAFLSLEYVDEQTGQRKVRVGKPGGPSTTLDVEPVPRCIDVDVDMQPVCYGRGLVFQPQARAENDCDSCRFQPACREASPRTVSGNPPRNPAENPDGTPGVAPAPASGPR